MACRLGESMGSHGPSQSAEQSAPPCPALDSPVLACVASRGAQARYRLLHLHALQGRAARPSGPLLSCCHTSAGRLPCLRLPATRMLAGAQLLLITVCNYHMLSPIMFPAYRRQVP